MKLEMRDLHEWALPSREIRNGLLKETTRSGLGNQ